MARELTKKQRGFVKDIIDTGNATKAALKNYDIKSKNKRNVAKSMGSENLTKPAIKKVLKPFLERLIAHRDKIQLAMDKKNLSKEQYRVLSEAMYKINHDIQLLSGSATERYMIADILDKLEK